MLRHYQGGDHSCSWTSWADIARFSQFNSSSVNFSESLKVEIHPKIDIPIDSEEIYRAAIDMMFQVSDIPTTHTLPNRDFLSPIGPSRIMLRHIAIGKEPSVLTTHTVIWGLNHLILSMTLTKKFCQTLAIVKWEGEEIGSLEVVPRRTLSSIHVPANATAVQQLSDGSSLSLGHFFDRLVTIETEWGKKPVDKHLLYLTGIRAMGDAAEMGLNYECPGIVSTGIQKMRWSLVREPGSHVPIFKAGYSRAAVYDALQRIIRAQRFDEFFVILKFAGELTAVGGFLGPLRTVVS